MLIDLSHLAAESGRRRAALLADAENFRLVRLSRAARRARTRIATPPAEPSRTPSATPETAEAGPDRPGRNDDAERRYAVP
jgi:hypothetical protein